MLSVKIVQFRQDFSSSSSSSYLVLDPFRGDKIEDGGRETSTTPLVAALPRRIFAVLCIFRLQHGLLS